MTEDLREIAAKMERENEAVRADWTKFLSVEQWPEELAARTRWIGKEEALAMYPMYPSR